MADDGAVYRVTYFYRDGEKVRVNDGPVVTHPSLNYLADYVGGCMFGVLTGALDARKVAYDVAGFRAEVTATMTGTDYFARIIGIEIVYQFGAPEAQLAATERALRVHPRGCAAHEKLAGQFPIRWRATVRSGERTTEFVEASSPGVAAERA